MHEVMSVGDKNGDDVLYPLPWASTPNISFLRSPEVSRLDTYIQPDSLKYGAYQFILKTIQSAGFKGETFRNRVWSGRLMHHIQRSSGRT